MPVGSLMCSIALPGGMLRRLTAHGGLAILLAAGAADARAQVTQTSIQTALSGPWNTGNTGPVGTAVDAAGNIYIGEHVQQDIVRLDAATHAASLFASNCNGVPLGRVQYMTTDASANLYVADPTNSAIDVFSTLTGQCTAQYSAANTAPFGVALDAQGNLFYTTYVLNSGQPVGVYEVPAGSPTGTAGTAVIASGITNGAGIAFDPASGDMLVADRDANTVNRYTAKSGFAASSETTYLAGLAQPYGLLFDAEGNLLVSLAGANTVERYAFPSATNPVELTPYLDGATGISRDAAGDLYVAGYGGHVVVEFAQGFGNVAVGSTSAVLSVNFAVQAGTTIGGFRYVAQGTTRKELLHVTADTNSYQCVEQLYDVDASCSVNVVLRPQYAGMRQGAVQVLDGAGAVLASAFVGGVGTGPQIVFTPAVEEPVSLLSGLVQPNTVTANGAGDLYLGGTDVNGDFEVVRETAGSNSPVVVASALTGTAIAGEHGLAIDGSGDVLVAGSLADGTATVFKETLTAEGGYVESVIASYGAGSKLGYAYGVAVDGRGNVFVAGADTDGQGLVVKETPEANGGYVESLVAAKAGGSAILTPEALAVDSAGNLYVTDVTAGAPIYEETPTPAGTYIESALEPKGSTTQHTFAGIAVDAHGNLYVADYANNAIYEETLAAGGYTESVLATSSLKQPYGIALDGSGNMYVADSGDQRVIEEDYADAPGLQFATVAAGSTGASQTITAANVGNASLSFPVPASGTNPTLTGDFVLDSSAAGACPAVGQSGNAGALAAGDSCTLTLAFAPTTSGDLSGSFVLTDTQGNAAAPLYATQTIALSGTAATTPAQVLLSGLPPSITAGGAFGGITGTVADANGNVITSSTASLTATITGPNGYVKTVVVPTVAGVAQFSFEGNAPTLAGQYTVTIAGEGLAAAKQTVNVTAAAPAKTALSGLPGSAVQGEGGGTLTVSIEDTYGNVVQSSAATVTATITAPDTSTKTVMGRAQNGVAQLNLGSVPLDAAGTYSIAVTSPGLPSSTIPLIVTAAPAAADFTMAVSSGTAASAGPVHAGQSAAYSITMAPSGSSYSSAIVLTATGLPANATATFAPAQVTPGSGPVTAKLTIQMSGGTARLEGGHPLQDGGPGRWAPVALGLLILPMAALRRVRRARGMLRLMGLAAVMLTAAAAGLLGCGGGSSNSSGSAAAATPTSYTITITGTSGSLSHATTVTLLEE